MAGRIPEMLTTEFILRELQQHPYFGDYYDKHVRLYLQNNPKQEQVVIDQLIEFLNEILPPNWIPLSSKKSILGTTIDTLMAKHELTDNQRIAITPAAIKWLSFSTQPQIDIIKLLKLAKYNQHQKYPRPIKTIQKATIDHLLTIG